MPPKTYLDENGKPRLIRVRKRTYPSRKNPLLHDRLEGVWYPDLVGKIHRYPKTEEDYKKLQERQRERVKVLRAEGKWLSHGKGVPKGWGGKKQLLLETRAKAARDAEKIMTYLLKEKLVDDDEMGNSALKAAFQIILAEAPHPNTADPTTLHAYPLKDRISAMRIVLEYTKAKPATKNVVEHGIAESYLENLKKAALAPDGAD